MYISYIEKINKTKTQVTLENSDCFIINEKDRMLYELEAGKDISDTIINQLYEEYFLPKSKLKALNLLKACDRSKKELYQRLKRDGFPEPVINQTIEYIESYHYINDERYAQNYIEYKGKTKSSKELAFELTSKGIELSNSDAVKEAFESHDDRKTILNILTKRWGSKPNPDLKEKERMTRYLARHGFAGYDVYSVYRDLGI